MFLFRLKNRSGAFALTAVLLAAVIFLWAFAGCSSRRERIKIKPKPTGSPSPSPQEKSAVSNLPPIQFKGTTIQAREGNRKHWELSAKEVKYSEGKKTATAEVVECVFFNAAGEKSLTVSARGAQMDIETKSLRFKGAVSIKSGQSESMEIKRLRWDGENKKLIGEGSVKIIRKDAVMTAGRMEADPELKKIKLYGNVSVTYPEAEEALKI